MKPHGRQRGKRKPGEPPQRCSGPTPGAIKHRFWKFFLPAGLLAGFTLWVSLELPPELGGPGVTCDELYHVYMAKRLVSALWTQGWEFFRAERIRENFPYGDPPATPFHPPLAYWVLGAVHGVFDFYPHDASSVSIISARFAGPVIFCCLLGIVWQTVRVREGWAAALLAVWACGTMPRLFGHAHLAGLDLLTSTTCLAAALTTVSALDKGPANPPGGLLPAGGARLLGAGFVLGLAMLTRFHGFLAIVPIMLWCFCRGGVRVLGWSVLYLAVAIATFFLGWPWLWLDPVGNWYRFVRASAQRMPLHVYYCGRIWQDVDVPWHYPFVTFASTVPIGLLVLGLVGLAVRLREAMATSARDESPWWRGVGRFLGTFEGMILLQFVFWLGLFAWPGIPVYDGERLFLVLYPLWSFPVAWGGRWIYEKARSLGRKGLILLGLLVATAGSAGAGNIVYRPVYLSYYNLLVGGLSGAASLGFEVNYWGDAVTAEVVEHACQLTHAAGPGESTLRPILFAPNLAPFQAAALNVVFRVDRTCGAEIVGWEAGAKGPPPGCHAAILYHRRADWEALPAFLKEAPVVYELSRQGVWLARVVKIVENLHGVGAANH